MVNYAPGFERAGKVAGGVAGAGAAGVLDQLLSPLDLPRQAAWNLIHKPVQASQQGDASLLAGLLPALAGIAVGLGTANPLLGALVAGGAQGLGSAVSEPTFSAPTVQDLTGTDDSATNFLVGALTDPLTFIGGGVGAKMGGEAGAKFGQNLTDAALWRGPRYATTAEDLAKMVDQSPIKMGEMFGGQVGQGLTRGQYLEKNILGQLRSSPDALAEIMPGSTAAASGSESMFFRRPDGGGTLVRGPQLDPSLFDPNTGMLQPPTLMPGPRPDIPEMLQAARSKAIPGTSLRIEQVAPVEPALEYVRDLPQGSIRDQSYWNLRNVSDQMMRDIGERGGFPWDVSGGRNVGFDADGALKVFDPGAVSQAPLVADMIQREPGMVENLLLKLLGSDQAIQRELALRVGHQEPAIPPWLFAQARPRVMPPQDMAALMAPTVKL